MKLLWQRLRHMLVALTSADKAINFAVYALSQVVHGATFTRTHGIAPLAVQVNARGMFRVIATTSFVKDQMQFAHWAVRPQTVREA